MNFSQASKLPEGTLVKVVRANNPGHDWWYKVGHIYTVGCCSSGDGAFGVMGEDGDVSPCDFGGWEFEELDAAPQPPALGGEPHVVGYMPDHPDGDPLILLEEHRAHHATLQTETAQLRILSADQGLNLKRVKRDYVELKEERDQLKTDLAERWEQIAELNSEIVKLKRRGDDAISNLKMARFALIDIKNGNASSLTTIREMAAEALKATESVSQYGEGGRAIMSIPTTYTDLGICREEDFEE